MGTNAEDGEGAGMNIESSESARDARGATAGTRVVAVRVEGERWRRDNVQRVSPIGMRKEMVSGLRVND